MFGYVKPSKGELRVWEYELWRAAYCGLCHTLKRRYGVVWTLLLNYDFCYLAILLCGAKDDRCTACKKRCMASPIRPLQVMAGNAALDYSADATVILSYHKIRDGIRDEHGWKRLFYRVLAFLARHGYRRAVERQPAFDRAVRENLDVLDRVEAARTPSLDRAADPFAKTLAAASEALPNDERRRILRELLYHTGRFIYIADAWDDVTDDLRSGSYNPVALRYNLNRAPDADTAAALSETLEQSAASAIAAMELLPLGDFTGIVENVLYLGLPAVANALRENGCVHKSQKGKRHGSL